MPRPIERPRTVARPARRSGEDPLRPTERPVSLNNRMIAMANEMARYETELARPAEDRTAKEARGRHRPRLVAR